MEGHSVGKRLSFPIRTRGFARSIRLGLLIRWFCDQHPLDGDIVADGQVIRGDVQALGRAGLGFGCGVDVSGLGIDVDVFVRVVDFAHFRQHAAQGRGHDVSLLPGILDGPLQHLQLVGPRVLHSVTDVYLGVLDEFADSADNLVEQNIVDAKINLNALCKLVAILLIVHVMAILVRDTLLKVRDVHTDGLCQCSRFIVILQDLDHVREVLLGMVVSSLVRLKPAGDANFQTGDIGYDVNGAAAGNCDCPFHRYFLLVSGAKLKKGCTKLWDNPSE